MKGRAGTSKLPFRAKLFTMPLYVISYPRKTYVSTREKFATVEIHTLYVIRCKSVSLTRKQAKRASGDRKVTKRATLSSLKPRENGRNIVGQQLPILLDVTCCELRVTCYMLGVVASACTPLPTRTQQLPTFLVQQCRELPRPRAKQSRTTTQSSSAFKIQDGDYTRENS